MEAGNPDESDDTQVTKDNDEILVFNLKRGDHWLNLDNSGSLVSLNHFSVTTATA